MELENLLQLLQAYGVTSFKNKEYDLELVSFDRSEEVDESEEDFMVDFTAARFTDDDEQEPN